MKRVVSLILVVLMMATMLCACGEETFTCDICGEEVNQKPNKVELLGEELKVCDSCDEAMDQVGDLANMLG